MNYIFGYCCIFCLGKCYFFRNEDVVCASLNKLNCDDILLFFRACSYPFLWFTFPTSWCFLLWSRFLLVISSSFFFSMIFHASICFIIFQVKLLFLYELSCFIYSFSCLFLFFFISLPYFLSLTFLFAILFLPFIL